MRTSDGAVDYLTLPRYYINGTRQRVALVPLDALPAVNYSVDSLRRLTSFIKTWRLGVVDLKRDTSIELPGVMPAGADDGGSEAREAPPSSATDEASSKLRWIVW